MVWGFVLNDTDIINLLSDSLWPSDTVLHYRSRLAIDLVMAWLLLGDKPLPKPMLTFYQLEPQQ